MASGGSTAASCSTGQSVSTTYRTPQSEQVSETSGRERESEASIAMKWPLTRYDEPNSQPVEHERKLWIPSKVRLQRREAGAEKRMGRR